MYLCTVLLHLPNISFTKDSAQLKCQCETLPLIFRSVSRVLARFRYLKLLTKEDESLVHLL